jgi:digeranylgeranylglycerophospholipid reductase
LKAEAAIIGGGPAGLITAREIAKRGYETHVFERNPGIGVPNHCAGLISIEGLKGIGIKSFKDFTQHEVRGVKLFSPNGECINIPGRRTRALVVDRTSFDQYLANEARKEGAAIHTSIRVTQLEREKGRFEGFKNTEGRVSSNIVIDAEGAHRLLLRKIGLVRGERGLAGMNLEVQSVEMESGTVEIWLDNRLTPGLFCWVIPLGGDRARVGLASRNDGVAERLDDFVKKRFGEVKITEARGGLVLTDGPIERTYHDGLLIVGDAAGQVKPTTGGGVVIGGLCALEAGVTAGKALEKDEVSSQTLSRYEMGWRDKLGRDMRSMILARRLLNRINNDEIDRVFEAIKREGLEDQIRDMVDQGDMDLQGRFITSALKKPRLLSIGLRIFGGILARELF